MKAASFPPQSRSSLGSEASPGKLQQFKSFQRQQWRPAEEASSPGSDAESRKSFNRAITLRREIREKAAVFDQQAKSRESGERLQHTGISPDFRSGFSDPQRKESIRKLNYDTVQFQLEEKRSRQHLLDQQRKLDRLALENQQKLLDLQQAHQRSQHLAQVSDYRDALDLQRQVKKVAQTGDKGGVLPDNLNMLGYELPEFRGQMYTIHRPKVVPTDPITFLSPRYIAPIVRMNSDPRLSLGEGTKRSPLGGLADYGQMTMRPSIFRDPVCHRHAGLNYRDTRSLIQ